MAYCDSRPGRRSFLKTAAAFTAGLSGLALHPRRANADDDFGIIGPRKGFTPEVGALTSMLAFTRGQVLQNVKGMSQQDLDFLIDAKANTIGALLFHLAATETLYALNTFSGVKWDGWSDEVKKKWEVPMLLGEPARKAIKGNSLDFYLTMLHEIRERSLAEFRKRDDKWLFTVDKAFGWNNYGKWFHVAEHESNHDGQIKFLKGRLPGAKPAPE
jgi:Protein of unknown function (DUF664)